MANYENEQEAYFEGTGANVPDHLADHNWHFDPKPKNVLKPGEKVTVPAPKAAPAPKA